jgi:predicted TIM-barrel fold metal-dependent hydrolase
MNLISNRTRVIARAKGPRQSFTFLAMTVFMVGCTHHPTGRDIAQQESFPAPTRVIDAHTHWDADKEHGVQAQPATSMETEFTQNHVVGAVVHLSRKRAGTLPLKPKTQFQFARCAGLALDTKPAEVEQGIKKGDYQCIKVYLGYVPRWAYDKAYEPFYRLAEKYQLPVVFHTGDPYDKDAPVKYADPLTVDEVAIKFRKVNFVLAHLGNPWIQSAAEVTYKNDNVYADTSALMLGDLDQANPESVEELVVKPIRWFYLYVENPKKILFGTDWPLCKIGPYLRAVQKAIPKEHWDDVFYQNAARIFKLSKP